MRGVPEVTVDELEADDVEEGDGGLPTDSVKDSDHPQQETSGGTTFAAEGTKEAVLSTPLPAKKGVPEEECVVLGREVGQNGQDIVAPPGALAEHASEKSVEFPALVAPIAPPSGWVDSGRRRARKSRAKEQLSPPAVKCKVLQVDEGIALNRFAPLCIVGECQDGSAVVSDADPDGDEETKEHSVCSEDGVSISSSWADAMC